MALGPQFDQAFQFANRLHGSQVRKKTTISYVSHLLGWRASRWSTGPMRTTRSPLFCTTRSRTAAALPSGPRASTASAIAWQKSSNGGPHA